MSPTTQTAGFDFACPSCGAAVHVDRTGEVRRCPSCNEKLTRSAQLNQLLARWYQPRRWRADLVRPTVPYLVERLWTANGQGERLFEGVSPKYANYDIFRHFVTKLMIQGIDEGWAELSFPEDPLAEDPQYELKIVDSEKFATGVERLFPEVDWNEPIAAELAERLKPPAESRELDKSAKTKRKQR